MNRQNPGTTSELVVVLFLFIFGFECIPTKCQDVSTVAPTFGPMSGATKVTISGYDFQNDSAVACQFGNSSAVPTNFVSENEVFCVSPLFSQLPIYQNNQNDTSVELAILFDESILLFKTTFTYYQEPFLSKLSPSSGSPKGGEKIFILGGNFISTPEMSCKFLIQQDEISIRASYVNKTAVWCASPACGAHCSLNGSVAVASVQFSLNGQQYSEQGLVFAYANGQMSPVPTISPKDKKANVEEILLWTGSGLVGVLFLIGFLMVVIRNLHRKPLVPTELDSEDDSLLQEVTDETNR